MGWNFKSDLIFYTVPMNENGKMSGRVYVDAILESVIKKWLENGEDFVLKEDEDSGHNHTKGKNPAWL